MGYLEEIKKEKLKEVSEKQTEWVFQYRMKLGNHGEFFKNTKSNKETFFKEIYRCFLDEQTRRTFLVSNDFKKQYKCDELDIFLEQMRKFRFFAPSIFWHHKNRTKDELIWITSIVLDFDFSKDGTNRSFSEQEVAVLLRKEFGYDPNFVWESRTKTNRQAGFLINPMTGTEKSIYLFEAVAKRMAILVGADVVATSAVNLYAIPRKGYWKFSEEIHDIEDFMWVLEDDSINERLKELSKEKVVSITEKQILNDDAIKCLLNAEFDCYRNNAAFTIALLYYALGKDPEEAYDFLSDEWFKKVNGPGWGKRFLLREVKSTVKSAFSGKYHGPSREWIYLITGIDFNFNLFKSTYIKKEITDGGYRSANEVQLRILEWLKTNDGTKIKRLELCQQLDIPEKSLRRNLKSMQENGFIEYETKSGPKGYLMITDKRKNPTPFVVESSIEVNLDNIIDYFEEKVSV